VKIKVYTILLLFSFLLVVVHGIIPHHHHDHTFSHVGEKNVHFYGLTHSHKNEEVHHHNKPTEDSGEHGHSAPFHIHTSIAHDYDFLRIKSFSYHDVVIKLPAFLNNVVILRLIPPPDFKDFKFNEFPVLIPPEPASVNALLRAPPVFA
jgi:hypothetical protein